MDFKVGDEVYIRKDIGRIENAGLTFGMKKCAGTHAKIIKIHTTMQGINHYYLKIDDSYDDMSFYWWLAEWLEPTCDFDLKDECGESFLAFLAE